MKMKKLVEKYLQSSFDKSDANAYISRNNIDIEIHENIVEFIEKICSDKLIKEEGFHVFSTQLSTLNREVKNCIIHLLYAISSNKYADNKEEIEHVVTSIERHLKEGKEIPLSSGENAKKYIGLLNCYQLFAHHLALHEVSYNIVYPGIAPYIKDMVAYEIPFAINALRLVGKIPTTDNFKGFNISKPFYPLKLNVVKAEKIPSKVGVKKSDDYFPYKKVSKIAKGDTGDNTFVATNGKKILFVRGVEHYSPNAILASKIATLVSPGHFSSERLLDNRLVGSRGIPGYAVSVADDRTRNDRKQYIEQEKRIFPGSGIIDEVTNFVGETDINIENFGFSSEKVYKSHLTKIDFDRCSIFSKISKDNYEKNILTRPTRGIYHGASHVQTNPDYIKEKLCARLKLSMLPKALLSALANKAFAPKDAHSEDKAVEECTNRSAIALELFFEHPQVKSFLNQNPSIFNSCYHQIAAYIATHFEEKNQELLLGSLRERVEVIHNNIEKKLGIKLTLTDYKKTEIIEISSLIEHERVEQDVHFFVEAMHSTKIDGDAVQRTEPGGTKSENTFLSRNWLKLLGITLLPFIGERVGVALTATGLFASFDVGVVELTVGVAGFSAGLAIGGATSGSIRTYDEYQHLASNPVGDLDEDVEPSPSVQNVIQQVKTTGQRLENGIARAEKTLVQVHEKSKIQEHHYDLSTRFDIK